MSILIEGIELPKENQRGLWVVIHADGTVEYDSGDEGWKTLKQAAYPVPPHGRLGDLDKIENEIAQLSPEDYTTGGIRLILDSAPTIIPAEEE